MDKRKVIGIDIDGPLFPFWQQLAFWVSTQTRRPVKEFTEPQVWDFHAQWGLTKTQWHTYFESFVVEAHGWRPLAVPVEAVNVLGRLAETHRLVFVTARGCHSQSSERFRREARKQTIKFLSELGFGDAPLVFTPNKSLVKLDVLIDDCPQHLAEMNCRVICWDAAYNREWTGERVRNWLEVEEILRENDGVKTVAVG